MDRIGHSDFVREMYRLSQAQLDAKTDDDRDAADAAMRHLLRMNAAGRLQEYFASRTGGTDGE